MTSINAKLKPGTRALLMTRISKGEPRSTSIPGQLARLRVCQKSHGWVTVDEVKDEGVSGRIDPAKRPGLGPWLTPEGLAQWDVMLMTRQDRLGRDDLHFFAFALLMLQSGKEIVVLENPRFDLSTPHGRADAMRRAADAAEELNLIRQRVADMHKVLRDLGVYGGGQEPAGYLPVRKHEDEHAIFELESQFAEMLRDKALRVRRGTSPNSLALEMNELGVLTWRDRRRQLKREQQKRAGVAVTAPKPEGKKWRASVLTDILRSPAIAGYLMHKGEIYHLDSGEPVMITEAPILTHDDWRATVQALDARPKRTRTIKRKATVGEASGVGTCSGCGGALYHQVTPPRPLKSGPAVYRYYRCAARGNGIPCPAPASIRAEELEAFCGGIILGEVGAIPEVVKMREEGHDPTPDIEDVSRRIAKLNADYVDGRYEDDEMLESYFDNLRSMTARKKKLQAEPVRPARTWYESTGRTVGEAWEAMKTVDRRGFLYDTGTRIVVWRHGAQRKKAGVAVRLGSLQDMAEGLHGLPPVEPSPPPIVLRNLSKAMYLDAVKEGRFTEAPAQIRR